MVQIMCFNLIANKPVLKGFPLDEHFGLQPVQLDEGRGTNRTESSEWERTGESERDHRTN